MRKLAALLLLLSGTTLRPTPPVTVFYVVWTFEHGVEDTLEYTTDLRGWTGYYGAYPLDSKKHDYKIPFYAPQPAHQFFRVRRWWGETRTPAADRPPATVDNTAKPQ